MLSQVSTSNFPWNLFSTSNSLEIYFSVHIFYFLKIIITYAFAAYSVRPFNNEEDDRHDGGFFGFHGFPFNHDDMFRQLDEAFSNMMKNFGAFDGHFPDQEQGMSHILCIAAVTTHKWSIFGSSFFEMTITHYKCWSSNSVLFSSSVEMNDRMCALSFMTYFICMYSGRSRILCGANVESRVRPKMSESGVLGMGQSFSSQWALKVFLLSSYS